MFDECVLIMHNVSGMAVWVGNTREKTVEKTVRAETWTYRM
jgi:hypothetical protein